MRFFGFLQVLGFALAACSPTPQYEAVKTISPPAEDVDTDHYAHYATLYPAVRNTLNKKIITAAGNYYVLLPDSDSTFQISWGNDTVRRVYSQPFGFLFAQRISVDWENDNYLILHCSTGSNAWSNIALPLSNNEQVEEFSNGVGFDKKYNLLAMQGFDDTLFVVRNLKTRHTQSIIESGKLCDAGSNSSCVDTVSINDRVIYYRWATWRARPRRFDAGKRNERRFQLTI